MNILYPKFRLAELPAMIGYSLTGSILAGVYGVLNDQITYSISPEYFTRLKFSQFHYADFGFPRRVFVGEIGFLATWWVGFFVAWFIARIVVPAFVPPKTIRYTVRGFLIIFAFVLAASVVGYTMGIIHNSDYSSWRDLGAALGVVDLPNFVRVAYIHNASYLGGLVGLVIAIIYLLRLKSAETITTPQTRPS